MQTSEQALGRAAKVDAGKFPCLHDPTSQSRHVQAGEHAPTSSLVQLSEALRLAPTTNTNVRLVSDTRRKPSKVRAAVPPGLWGLGVEVLGLRDSEVQVTWRRQDLKPLV